MQRYRVGLSYLHVILGSGSSQASCTALWISDVDAPGETVLLCAAHFNEAGLAVDISFVPLRLTAFKQSPIKRPIGQQFHSNHLFLQRILHRHVTKRTKLPPKLAAAPPPPFFSTKPDLAYSFFSPNTKSTLGNTVDTKILGPLVLS